MLACNLANTPPFNQTRSIRVIYTYELDKSGGVEFAFLAHRVIWVYDASQGPLPDLESVQGEEVLHPVKGMRFYIFGEHKSQAIKGKTDYSGHLSLVSDTSLIHVTYDEGLYSCAVVNEWQTYRKGGNLEGGGAVWQCSEVSINP